MDSVLHKIAALPGEGRYAVTFRRADGSEQTAVMHVRGDVVDVAEAGLPVGWTIASADFTATARAVCAFDDARRLAPSAAVLRDVAGGWDVSLGNVVLGPAGVPTCTAHGELIGEQGEYVCADCGARATLA
jgi:hypothetical protein